MQINRSTFSILFYLNTSKKKKSGKCPLVGRITVDGKSTAFSTGLELLPEQWDSKQGLATGKSKEETDINKQIKQYRADLTGYYKTLLETKSYITAETLKNALLRNTLHKNTLMQEFAELIEEKTAGCRYSDNIFYLSEIRTGLQAIKEIPVRKIRAVGYSV